MMQVLQQSRNFLNKYLDRSAALVQQNATASWAEDTPDAEEQGEESQAAEADEELELAQAGKPS